MNKNKQADYSHITSSLLKEVKKVVEDARIKTYSVSLVYKAHNAVFKENETPQTCTSCVRNRARRLATWYDEYMKFIELERKVKSELDANVENIGKTRKKRSRKA